MLPQTCDPLLPASRAAGIIVPCHHTCNSLPRLSYKAQENKHYSYHCSCIIKIRAWPAKWSPPWGKIPQSQKTELASLPHGIRALWDQAVAPAEPMVCVMHQRVLPSLVTTLLFGFHYVNIHWKFASVQSDSNLRPTSLEVGVDSAPHSVILRSPS